LEKNKPTSEERRPTLFNILFQLPSLKRAMSLLPAESASAGNIQLERHTVSHPIIFVYTDLDLKTTYKRGSNSLNVADFFFNSLEKTAAGGEETAAKMF
jgi:hypothetical protein